ncbi:hypothetical protein Tco_1007753, partial [Tanacetum coccineum]
IRALEQQEYATGMAAWTSEISSFKKFVTSLQKLLNAQEDARLRIDYNQNYLQLSAKGSNAELVIASVYALLAILDEKNESCRLLMAN